MEYYISSKSDLLYNVQKNDPTPPCLTHDTTVCRIDEKKVTYLVGEILRNKIRHKELRSFIYNRRFLQTHDFDLVYWSVLEHTMKIVPNIF